MAARLSTVELAQLCEAGEGEGWLAITQHAPPAREHIMERHGSIYFTLARKNNHSHFNRVFGLGLGEPASKANVDQYISRFNSAGVANFAVQIIPAAEPAALPAWLESWGLRPREVSALVYRRPDAQVSVPTALSIRRVEPEQAAAFAQIVMAVFGASPDYLGMFMQMVGLPDSHHYMAWDGDQPVATGSLLVKDGIGWLVAGATASSHRQRGAQGAIMAQRIRMGAALGCEWLVTDTELAGPDQPNSSLRNMLRTGFQIACYRQTYLSMPH